MSITSQNIRIGNGVIFNYLIFFAIIIQYVSL